MLSAAHRLTAPTTPAERRADERLAALYAETRDPRLREALVERYLSLARHAAGKYARSREPFDDLLQVACVGLLKAIESFDPTRGSAFSTYALPTMTGELRRHFRDRSWTVRPPRDLQENALRVDKISQQLVRELGHAPTVEQLVARTGLSAEAVLEAREALYAHTALSLSAPSASRADGDEPALADRLGSEDPEFTQAERRATLHRLTRCLTPREREILRLRLEEDLTQREIGRRLGLSQMHVSRLLRALLAKLRAEAAAATAA